MQKLDVKLPQILLILRFPLDLRELFHFDSVYSY